MKTAVITDSARDRARERRRSRATPLWQAHACAALVARITSPIVGVLICSGTLPEIHADLPAPVQSLPRIPRRSLLAAMH
jgi:hypothetical protein